MAFCSNCGVKNDDDSNFCINCGNSFYEIVDFSLPISTNKNNNSKIENANSAKNNNYQTMPNKLINNKRKKNLSIILASFFVIVALVIGGIYLKKSIFSGPAKTRTVMIYMVGSNLESESGFGTMDLDSLDYQKIDNDNLKIVLIAGGASHWNNDYIDISSTSIYEFTKNGYEIVKKQTRKDMGASETLSDFLKYVYDNYKTDEYDLVFWNHGGALDGSEYDDFSNNHLSISNFKKAFNDSPFNEKNKIEAVLFRTCLNGMLEMSNVLKDYADYLVASEEVTMAYYELDSSVIDFVNHVSANDSAIDLGKKFINEYKNVINAAIREYSEYEEMASLHSTYSLIDLSNVSLLTESFNSFISSLDLNNNFNDISKVRSNLYQYSNQEPSFDTVDLYNLVYNLKNLSSNMAQEFFDVFDDTVIYNWASNNNSKGLAVYFPYNGKKEYQNGFISVYNHLTELSDYQTFIKKFSDIKNNKKLNSSFASNVLSVNENTKNDIDFKMVLTDDQVKNFAKAEYIVFRNDEKDDSYYYPVYYGKEYNLEGNNLISNIKGKQLMIKDKNGFNYPITLVEKEVTDSYITYESTVTLEDYRDDDISKWKTDVATVNLIYNKNKNNVLIDSSVLVNDNNNDILLPNNTVVDYKNYQFIAFASSKYKIMDENGKFTSSWKSNGVLTGVEQNVDNLNIQLNDFSDNYTYYCIFVIYDTSNNYSYSNLIKMN